MHTASSAWRCGDVQRSVERWTRERAAVSCSRSSEAYNVKLASICRITVRRDVRIRSQMAGLHANASSLISSHSTAEKSTLRRVRRPITASMYCCLLKELRNALSDGRETTTESIDARGDIDSSASCIWAAWTVLA